MTNPAGEEKSSNVENKTPLPDFTDDRDHDSKSPTGNQWFWRISATGLLVTLLDLIQIRKNTHSPFLWISTGIFFS
jgi:hypothetical protein